MVRIIQIQYKSNQYTIPHKKLCSKMTCEYCSRNYSVPSNPEHTLYRCRAILPVVERHHLLNQEQAYHSSIDHVPQYTVNALITPILRCLAKRLGSSMNRNIQSLREYCIQYYDERRRAFLLSNQEQARMQAYREERSSMVRRVLNNITSHTSLRGDTPPTPSTSLFESLGIRRPSYITGSIQQGAQALPVGGQNERQGAQALPVGGYASQYQPDVLALPVGGYSRQQSNHAVAIGTRAGQNEQGGHAVALGTRAGQNEQGNHAVALGTHAGQNEQGNHAVALGTRAGQNEQQGTQALPVGGYARLDQTVQFWEVPRPFALGRQPPQPKVVLQQHQKKVAEKVAENVAELPTETTCCICLETDTYITTNCGHVFCNCILQHLSKNGVSCPMCRQPVIELNYEDADHLDTTLKMLPLLPAPLQNLFCSRV